MAIRLLLFSLDPKLQRLLSAVLRPEFTVLLEWNKDRLKQAAAEGAADVVVLDCDSNHDQKDSLLALSAEISDSPLPVIIMADDIRRSSTGEFIQRGVFDCVRKPPVLAEFKLVVKRAYEHAMMKSEVTRMREKLSACQGLGQLVGSSGRAQVVYDLIRRVTNLN